MEICINKPNILSVYSYRYSHDENGQTFVDGLRMDKSDFDKNYYPLKDIIPKVLKDYHNNGKIVTKKEFKELVDVHNYVTNFGQTRSKLKILFYTVQKWGVTVAFYPDKGTTKAKTLSQAYEHLKDMLGGDFTAIDNRDIQLGNGGIPINYRDIKFKYSDYET